MVLQHSCSDGIHVKPEIKEKCKMCPSQDYETTQLSHNKQDKIVMYIGKNFKLGI